jgi:hypothetical protein
VDVAESSFVFLFLSVAVSAGSGAVIAAVTTQDPCGIDGENLVAMGV